MHAQDLLKLVGVVIVVVGLALRLRTTLVVVVAALVTGLVAGLPLFSHEGFFQHLPYLTRAWSDGRHQHVGKAFADNRLMTLFIITLPAIGLAERYGLQEQGGESDPQDSRGDRRAAADRLSTLSRTARIDGYPSQRPSVVRAAVDLSDVGRSGAGVAALIPIRSEDQGGKRGGGELRQLLRPEPLAGAGGHLAGLRRDAGTWARWLAFGIW